MTGRTAWVSFYDVQDAGRVNERAGDEPGPARTAAMRQLVTEGWTYEAIGLLYGISRARAWQIVRKSDGAGDRKDQP